MGLFSSRLPCPACAQKAVVKWQLVKVRPPPDNVSEGAGMPWWLYRCEACKAAFRLAADGTLEPAPERFQSL